MDNTSREIYRQKLQALEDGAKPYNVIGEGKDIMMYSVRELYNKCLFPLIVCVPAVEQIWIHWRRIAYQSMRYSTE